MKRMKQSKYSKSTGVNKTMTEEAEKVKIVKIQRRDRAVFVTVPAEYAKKIEKSTYMKVVENEDGNLEYTPLIEEK